MDSALSVPANLLLLGEYAVLEPGGLGITFAPDVRCSITIADASSLVIEGIMRHERTVWRGETGAEPGLTGTLVARVEDYIRRREGSLPLKGRITVDSSPFYYEDGRKRGFGSSAAAAVGVTAALLTLAGVSRSEISRCCTLLALDGHSRFQGKRGSGYDILTSFHGGIGLFTGGLEPTVETLRLPWLPPLCLYRGEVKVASPKAIVHYQRWKEQYPKACRQFLQDSNRAVLGFAHAQTWEEARSFIEVSRDLGLELGRSIGVSAEIAVSGSTKTGLFKALGAGNELGILFDAPPDMPNSTRLHLAKRGLVWHS